MLRLAAIGALTALLAASAAVGQIQIERGIVSGPAVRTGSVTSEDPDSPERVERRCEYHLDRAERSLKEGKYYSARRSLKTAESLGCPRRFPSMAPRWAQLTEQFERAGQAMLEQADEKYDKGEYQEALKAYRRIAVTFAGLPAAERAKAGLDRAKSDPNLRIALAEARAAMMFRQVELAVKHQRRVLAKAASATTRPAATSKPSRAAGQKSELEVIKLLSDEKLAQAVEQMERIVKHCQGAPTAVKSAGYLAALKAGPKLKAKLARLRRRGRARQTLALAEAYFKAGMLKKAGQRYQEVIKRFPGTPQAAQAGKQLAAVEAGLKGAYKMGNER